MAWKPKEKELTKEEAVAAAKKQLAPYWIGSTPLVAGVEREGALLAFPLEEAFEKKPWLVFHIDPTSLSGRTALTFAREFHQRYARHELGMLFVLEPRYDYLNNRDLLETFLRREQLEFPLVIDHDGRLSAALGIRTSPELLLIDQARIISRYKAIPPLDKAEIALQKFLRSRDPGLALLTPYESRRSLHLDTLQVDFARDVKPASGKGNWKRASDHIWTNDKDAEISIRIPGASLFVIARSLAKVAEPAKIVVQTEEGTVLDVFAGDDLSYDEDGNSLLKIEQPRLYHALEKTPEKQRNVTLRFPFADKVPVALYGIRVGKIFS